MTVEEGERAILECPGFVPDPDNPTEKEQARFTWMKGEISYANIFHEVAVYDKSENGPRFTGDLEGRASIDLISGILVINETRVTDDHHYTCHFRDTAKGLIYKETLLIITGKAWDGKDMSPSPQPFYLLAQTMLCSTYCGP